MMRVWTRLGFYHRTASLSVLPSGLLRNTKSLVSQLIGQDFLTLLPHLMDYSIIVHGVGNLELGLLSIVHWLIDS